ncbi:MAG: alpha/beta hydrolase, partial [Blastocatellia bacterium]|nr:alpha/beta hydrolase [Blastocatellia bacterium]
EYRGSSSQQFPKKGLGIELWNEKSESFNASLLGMPKESDWILFGKLIPDSRFKQSLASIFGKDTQPTEAELNDFVTLFRYNDGKKVAHKLIRYMSERAKYRERWVGALERTRIPLRFINGLADPVSGAHLVKRFREVMPHEDIIELVEIGHFPHFEAPKETLRHFFDFHTQMR